MIGRTLKSLDSHWQTIKCRKAYILWYRTGENKIKCGKTAY